MGRSDVVAMIKISHRMALSVITDAQDNEADTFELFLKEELANAVSVANKTKIPFVIILEVAPDV